MSRSDSVLQFLTLCTMGVLLLTSTCNCDIASEQEVMSDYWTVVSHTKDIGIDKQQPMIGSTHTTIASSNAESEEDISAFENMNALIATPSTVGGLDSPATTAGYTAITNTFYAYDFKDDTPATVTIVDPVALQGGLQTTRRLVEDNPSSISRRYYAGAVLLSAMQQHIRTVESYERLLCVEQGLNKVGNIWSDPQVQNSWDTASSWASIAGSAYAAYSSGNQDNSGISWGLSVTTLGKALSALFGAKTDKKTERLTQNAHKLADVIQNSRMAYNALLARAGAMEQMCAETKSTDDGLASISYPLKQTTSINWDDCIPPDISREVALDSVHKVLSYVDDYKAISGHIKTMTAMYEPAINQYGEKSDLADELKKTIDLIKDNITKIKTINGSNAVLATGSTVINPQKGTVDEVAWITALLESTPPSVCTITQADGRTYSGALQGLDNGKYHLIVNASMVDISADKVTTIQFK